MAVVAVSAVERFRGISSTEAAKSGLLGSPCKLQYQSSVNFHVNVCEVAEETGYESRIWSCSVQRSNHTMAFENIIKVVHESLLDEGKDRSGGCNGEIREVLSGLFTDGYVSNTKRILFDNIWAMVLNAGRGIGFGSNESVSKFGYVGNHLEIADEEIDGDQDDRQKRKQTDSKHGGDKGKNSRSDGGSTSSSACGTGDGGSSGDDGGDDGEKGGRRESGGPQSATDEAMEEDEEDEDSVEREKGEKLDITGIPGFSMPGTASGAGIGTGQDNRRAEEERAQARRRDAAEAAVAAAAEAAAAAAAEAAAAAARRAEEEGGGDEARAGPSRPVSRTDEEDPEEVGQRRESPDTPSEGSPSQTPTPPPDVTEAIDATDL